MRSELIAAIALAVLMFALAHSGHAAGTYAHTSEPFAGVKANTGTVTHSTEGGRSALTLSDDFEVPDTPDPHWQVVDSKGRTYLLQRLPVKGDKVNRSIIVPAYVPDVA